MTCLMSALPPRLSLLLLESERSVLVHEKGKKKTHADRTSLESQAKHYG